MLLAAGCWLVYVATASGGFEIYDAELRFATAKSWLDGQGGALTPTGGSPGHVVAPDGRHFSFFGPLQSVTMLPAIGLIRASPIGEGHADTAAKAVYSAILVPAFAAFTLILIFHALKALGYSSSTSTLSTIAVGLGTFFWHYARMGQEECLVAFGFSLWLWGYTNYSASGRPLFLSAAAIGGCIAIATRWATLPALAVLGLATLGAVWLKASRFRASTLALPAVVCVATVLMLLLFNWQRFSDPFETGYQLYFKQQQLTLFAARDTPAKALALLVSPYRGFFIYSPLLLIAAFGQRPAMSTTVSKLHLIAIAALLVNVLFLSTYAFWDGAFAWGPRFLVSNVVLFAPSVAALFQRFPRTRHILLPAVALQLFSVTLPAATENLIQSQAPAGECSPWTCRCTAICLRPGLSLGALSNTLSNGGGSALAVGTKPSPNAVLQSSDYTSLNWWPVRIARRFSPPNTRWGLFGAFALLLIGFAAAGYSVKIASRSLIP